jgi:hypothetical protein
MNPYGLKEGEVSSGVSSHVPVISMEQKGSILPYSLPGAIETIL